MILEKNGSGNGLVAPSLPTSAKGLHLLEILNLDLHGCLAVTFGLSIAGRMNIANAKHQTLAFRTENCTIR